MACRVAQNPGTRALAWVGALSLAELLRGHILTGFPWALPAYIWVDTPVIHLAAFTGSFGLTILTLGLAAALAMQVFARVTAPTVFSPLR